MNFSAFRRIALEASILLQILLVIIGIFCSRSVIAAAPSVETVIGLHVRSKNDALEDTYEKTFAHAREVCLSVVGRAEPLPAGAKVQESFLDRYYVPGAVTTYIVDKSYFYQMNQSCKLVQKTEVKITIEVTGGFCYVNPQKRTASGKCKVPLAQLSQRLTRLKLPFNGIATGQTRMIAGQSCTVYEQVFQKFLSRWCIAKKDLAGGFAAGEAGMPGARLSEMMVNNDPSKPAVGFEAIEVEVDTPIPVNILLPQLFGNYRLMGG